MQELALEINRRTFLAGGIGLGTLAYASLLGREGVARGATSSHLGLPGLPHFAPKARRVIFLCMAGGPSHLETFDYKPKLAEMDGKPMPESLTAGQPIAQLQGEELICRGPMTRFKRHGQNGQEISDFLPWHAEMADDICIIRSMVTEQINHDPAHTFMNTGTVINGHPSMGAWINYGLGNEAENLPGFVVMTSVGGRSPQPIASRQWSAGFLPGRFQGVEFHSTGEPVHYLNPPDGVSRVQQRKLVRTIGGLDQLRNQVVRNPTIDARLAAMELAFRMQTSIPDLMDVSDEPQWVLDRYGATPGDGSYAGNCLLARRLAERGVRFIHLYHRGWDHHDDLVKYMNDSCGQTDKPTWALITDLKQRGMLEETLVIWSGEFGRTPMAQKGDGRDHHVKGFSCWLAGGGIRGGMTHGATDDLGYNSVQDVVHIRDLHATMLHQLGIDHERLSVPFQGLDTRLTGVEPARVISEVLV